MASARKNKTTHASIDGCASQAPREIELKLALDAPTLARIRKAGALTRLPNISSSGRGTVQNLITLYWDTKDHALAKAGMAMRVRRDGGRVVQALKAADGTASGGGGGIVANRAEDEAMRPAAAALTPPDLTLVVDEALRARALAVIAGADLVPVFESAISRVARELDVAGGARFEAALDLGEVRLPPSQEDADGARDAICEIELEHRAGPVTTLFDVAAALAARYPLKVSTLSKVKRGYQLAAEKGGGAALPVALPVKAGRSPVRPGMTVDDAYGVLISHSVHQMAANQTAIVTGRLPVGIHQMRVAIRRLRAVHAAFRRAIPLENDRQLIDRMKDAFRPLGDARDLDIFCTETVPEMRRKAGEAGPSLVPLAAAAQELREKAWDRAVGIVDARSFTRLLLDAGRFGACAADVAAGSAGEKRAIPLTDFAVMRLGHRHRQVMKQAANLATLDDEARHDLRKRIKALRYEAAFFAPLWRRDDVKAFMRPVKRLQDQLGMINDAATAASVARLAAMEIGGDRAFEAAGFVGGWYASQADVAFGNVIEMWPAFEGLEGFWHRRPL